jgi:predicted GIY-YIG superfamily endonuclease
MKCGVYLLKFDSGKTYLGSTNDLDRRIIQHTQGLVRSSAKLGRFLGVLAFQETSCLTKARSLDRTYKSWKNSSKVLIAMKR